MSSLLLSILFFIPALLIFFVFVVSGLMLLVTFIIGIFDKNFSYFFFWVKIVKKGIIALILLAVSYAILNVILNSLDIQTNSSIPR